MQNTIIGLGWLGQSLAERLNQQGHDVIGTVRQLEKQQALLNKGIQTYLFDCYQEITSPLASTLFNGRNIIINIAAGRRNINPDAYVTAIQNLINTAKENDSHKIIFISTSSVFANNAGEVTNQTKVNPESPSGIAHHQIEEYLLSNYPQANVLRLAGLVGPNPEKGFRHPIHSLVSRSPLSNPDDSVNLIHKYDVISAIQILLEKNHDGRTFNLCSSQHPNRADYYQWCTQKLNLPALTFVNKHEEAPKTKRINAKDTLDDLGLSLNFPTPYDMLP